MSVLYHLCGICTEFIRQAAKTGIIPVLPASRMKPAAVFLFYFGGKTRYS